MTSFLQGAEDGLVLRALHGHKGFPYGGDLFAGPRLLAAEPKRFMWVLRARNGAVGLVLRVTAHIQEVKQRAFSVLAADVGLR